MEAWEKKVERMENNPRRKAKESRTREYYERQFPEIRKQREQQERFQRYRPLPVTGQNRDLKSHWEQLILSCWPQLGLIQEIFNRLHKIYLHKQQPKLVFVHENAPFVWIDFIRIVICTNWAGACAYVAVWGKNLQIQGGGRLIENCCFPLYINAVVLCIYFYFSSLGPGTQASTTRTAVIKNNILINRWID